MQLTYRGIRYTPNPALPTTSKTIRGCYRGIRLTLHYSSKMPIQPFFNLRYRGIDYRPLLISPSQGVRTVNP
ncbi:MAG: hypothetical protein Fur0046_18310 [Cyanobacteria bacterium J069]|nr:MAG: DUF4278 domain-containing protein [Cyanobacteria bacterium J069]